MYAEGYVGCCARRVSKSFSADWTISRLGDLFDCNLRMMSVSRFLSDAKSVSEMFRDDGHEGSDESTMTPDDGEDSASNRACSTAESLDVNDGRAVVMEVILGIGVEVKG